MKLRWYERICLRIATRRLDIATPAEVPDEPLDMRNNPDMLGTVGAEFAEFQMTQTYKYLNRRLSYKALEIAKAKPDMTSERDMWMATGQIKAYLSVQGLIDNIVTAYRELIRRQQEGAN